MYLLIAALVIAGWIAVFISSRRALEWKCAEPQRQIDSLSARVRDLEQAAEARTLSAVAESVKTEPSAGTAVPSVAAQSQALEEITPETLATIAETVTALLGRKVRVRSVKLLPTPDAIVNPWAQQGRAVIQASHNLSERRREP
jgi:hypothetical protein